MPLIIADSDPRGDTTRGTVCDALVEAIDLVPSFLEYFGGVPTARAGGPSLLPLLRGERPADWRRCVFSEYDYSMQEARLSLNQPIRDCRLFMVFDGRWKYIHATGFRPMLFDLATDPDEFHDLGADPRRGGTRTTRGGVAGVGATRPQPHHDAGPQDRRLRERRAA